MKPEARKNKQKKQMGWVLQIYLEIACMTQRSNVMLWNFWNTDFGEIIAMDYMKFGSLDDESHQMEGSDENDKLSD